jgi:hypothetical protein
LLPGFYLFVPMLMLDRLRDIAKNTAAILSELSSIDHAIGRATNDDPYMPGALGRLTQNTAAMRKSLEEIEKALAERGR